MILGLYAAGMARIPSRPLAKLSPPVVHFAASPPPVDWDIVRLVVEGPPAPQKAETLLKSAFKQWPAGKQARFLITPGAFVEAPWPDSAPTTGWQSDPAALRPLAKAAEAAARSVLTPKVRALAQGKVRYMTLGVDLTTDRKMKGPHAELVGVYDVARDRFVGWTGKSYPLAVQEQTLVQITDLDSHLFRLDGEDVLVLGCHDLNMFSPRAYANQKAGSERRRRTEAMGEAADRFSPTLVLQHPHGTDTPNIWLPAWRAVERRFPRLKSWASAIGFYNFLDPAGNTRSSLSRTLRLTRSSNGRVHDLVVDTRKLG